MPYTITQVSNHDIAGLVVRIDEILYEVLKSQSAGQNDTVSFDRVRIDQYVAALKHYMSWVAAAPEIDLPETHPRMHQIKYLTAEEGIDIENKALRDLVRMLQAAITELTASQSANRASGISTHDKRRFDLIIQKIELFLTEYVDLTHPMDMPESAPSSPPVGPGIR